MTVQSRPVTPIHGISAELTEAVCSNCGGAIVFNTRDQRMRAVVRKLNRIHRCAEVGA